MIETEESAYRLTKDATTLVFRTTRFVAERGSVLHSGIYNREFSSVLASFAVAGMAYFALVMGFGKRMVFLALFLVLFIGTFPLFRTYLFKERFLEVVFDKAAGDVVISRTWFRKKVLERMELSEIKGLWIDAKKDEVVNRDGVAFVEKISAQHHTVIPGFGEETVFYSLKLKRADGTDRTIFAGDSMKDALAVYDEIKGFLNI